MPSLSFVSIGESSAPVNLSSPVRTAWLKVGDGGVASITPTNSKPGSAAYIAESLYPGTTGLGAFSDSTRPISATDGQTPISFTNNTEGVYDTTSGGVGTVGGGFSYVYQLGAGTNLVEVYSGGWASRSTVRATVSDGSSPAIVDTTSLNDSDASGMAGATFIECTPSGPGCTLTVEVFSNLLTNVWGNTTYCATALTRGADPVPDSAAAGDYAEKRRKRKVLEALALKVMEDERDEESKSAPLLQPKVRAVEVKAKQFHAKKQQATAKHAGADDEDEFEAMMLLT